MSRVLLVSGDRVGRRMAGPGIRALEMARALSGHGIDVVLAAPNDVDLELPFDVQTYDASGARLREVIGTCDAAVLGGMVLARQPWLAHASTPLVVDVYGPYVLENLPAAGANAAATGDSGAARRRRRHAGDIAAMNLELERGDFFLCASEKQRDFWLGALTALGRVNPHTYAQHEDMRRLIDVVPFGVPVTPPVRSRHVLQGVVPGIGADDSVVLWSGGLWDWLDPLTLIRAHAQLSRSRPDVKLFFMGARTPSTDVPPMAVFDASKALARELAVLDSSVFFHDDWVPYDDRADYLLDADVAVSLHHPHIETRFAFRTRLLDCIWASLPMLVTGGDVLSAEVAARRVGLVVEPGDVSAVAAGLMALLDASDDDASRARSFQSLRDTYAWPRVVEPLVRFSQAPMRAPDQPAAAGAAGSRLAPTPVSDLPGRAIEALREGGPLMLAEEISRYLRWRRRSG